MPKYTSDDIKTINALDHIRANPWMHVHSPKDPLPSILSILTESFIHLGVKQFSIQEEPNFFIVKTSTDWFAKSEITLNEAFNGLHGNSKGRWINRAEVFLTAFYFPYFTRGNAGDYGDEKLMEKFSHTQSRELLKHNGRILLISKELVLPESHGIVFEQPPQSLAELENQRALLDEVITHIKHSGSK